MYLYRGKSMLQWQEQYQFVFLILFASLVVAMN